MQEQPLLKERGPGGLHLGAMGPAGLPWSSADAAVSRRQCPLAAAPTLHLHWRRHLFDHFLTAEASITSELFAASEVLLCNTCFSLNPGTV